MFNFLPAAASVAAFVYAAAVAAQPAAGVARDPAAAFGARESVESISLSPDGSKLAYVAPIAGQGSALYTVDLASGDSRRSTAVDGRDQRLRDCSWVSNARLVCTVFTLLKDVTDILPVSRVVALDADGQNVKLLSDKDSFYQKYANLYGGGVVDWLPEEDGMVLMARQYVPEIREGTRLEKKDEGLGIDRIDTRTVAQKRIETPNRHAVEYISDGRGNIRIMGSQLPQGDTGRAGRKISYFYRTRESGKWQPFSEYDVISHDGLNPLAVDPQLDAVYALEKVNGRQALHRVALDGSMRKELVFAHPEVDVDGLVRIGRSQRPVGASYATEHRRAVYFDGELKRLGDSLSKALPRLPLIRFIDSSVDERKLLIWAGSDTDPGRYYLYDKSNRNLSEIMLSRPQLEGVKLAEVKAVTYKAADGTAIPAYLTLPPGSSGKGLPAIVMPHGGPSARDEWGFDWLAQFYANRGFAVLQPNFRGSAGYGDEWFKRNGFQSWRTAVGDVVDSGRWLISQGVADPSKLAILGWSYGGYAALQSNLVQPDLFKAVVAIAPVTDLNLLREQYRNWSSFALARDFIGSGPHLQDGSPAQNADRIKAPVLMFHGDLDRNVEISASKLMERRLRNSGKQVELVVYPGLDHYLEDSQARSDVLRRSDRFLRSALKM